MAMTKPTSDQITFLNAVTLPGDLAVNGGDITTTSTGTATVFNTNATTLNVGGAATTVSLGAATGTTTINNAATVSADLAVNGGDITTSATGTATVFNTNATTLNVGGAATTVSIGAATGTATVNNATFQFNSGYGSAATAYACRAWVNFQASSGTRNGSGNVSSVTDNGNGDYTVNLQNAMPDTNYSVSAIARKINDLVDGAWTIQFSATHTATTSAIQFATVFSPVSTSPVLTDGSLVFFQLFR
jgi:hypothetical protein